MMAFTWDSWLHGLLSHYVIETREWDAFSVISKKIHTISDPYLIDHSVNCLILYSGSSKVVISII